MDAIKRLPSFFSKERPHAFAFIAATATTADLVVEGRRIFCNVERYVFLMVYHHDENTAQHEDNDDDDDHHNLALAAVIVTLVVVGQGPCVSSISAFQTRNAWKRLAQYKLTCQWFGDATRITKHSRLAAAMHFGPLFRAAIGCGTTQTLFLHGGPHDNDKTPSPQFGKDPSTRPET
ncbi:hypothetical protein ACA910_010372 [Epithemia clementina (nom. ined.)]